MSQRWQMVVCALWGAAVFGAVGCGTAAVPGDAANAGAADAASEAGADATSEAGADAASEAGADAASEAGADAATDAAAAQFPCGPTERCTVGTQVCRTPNRPGVCPAKPTPDNCRPGCMGCPALPDPSCVAVPPACAATPTCECVVGATCTSMPGLSHTCTAAGGGLALQCTSAF